jgi:aspartyl-tRNA(Asn)/glutamyl-tRNA(Gln) amidotransferase subunit A
VPNDPRTLDHEAAGGVGADVEGRSVATAAFERALAVARTWNLQPADRRPAYDLRVLPDRASPESRRRAAPKGRISEAAAALRNGGKSCRDLVDEALTAIERDSDRLGAFVEVLADEARATADTLDAELRQGEDRGALHGIPVSIKDVIDVAGATTRAGSEAYHEVAVRDAASVAMLRRAGAIMLGKTSTHEFALGVTTPQARNPHDPSRIPGGSSGGSGIAVATGMGLASLGTDTRASTRVPAALCGVVGLKPTFGLLPTDGVVPLSWTMDHVGILAPSVEDAAVVLDVLTGPVRQVAPSAGRSINGVRIGVPDAALQDSEPEVLSSFNEALELLRSSGAEISSCGEPDELDLGNANAAGLVASRCEAAAFHRSRGIDRKLLWAETRDQLNAADNVLATDYIDCQRFRSQLRDRMLGLFEEYDVLAMPTTPVTAPLVERAEEYLLTLSRNAIPWSLLGFPALSVPSPTSSGQLPVGFQLVARPHAEEVLVVIGSRLFQPEPTASP